jgi:hypothetical protein
MAQQDLAVILIRLVAVADYRVIGLSPVWLDSRPVGGQSLFF